MPIQATQYAQRFPLPDVIERGVNLTLEAPIYSGALLAAPSSGTCTIYDEDGATVSTGAVTVASSVATYAILGTLTSPYELAMNWRVEWSLVMPDTRTYRFSNPAALVLRRIWAVLTDTDLISGRYHDLNRYLPAGTTSWESWRVTSWEEIQRRLLKDERRPWLIMDPGAMLDVHRDLTLSLVFSAIGMTQRTSERDWTGLARDHRDAYERGWRSLSFAYDTSETRVSPERVSARPPLVLCSVGSIWRS